MDNIGTMIGTLRQATMGDEVMDDGGNWAMKMTMHPLLQAGGGNEAWAFCMCWCCKAPPGRLLSQPSEVVE